MSIIVVLFDIYISTYYKVTSQHFKLSIMTYSVQFTHSVHCILYSVHCTMYTVHCTVCTLFNGNC